MPGEAPASGQPAGSLAVAAEELVTAGRRWADLTPGATWVVEWRHHPGRRR